MSDVAMEDSKLRNFLNEEDVEWSEINDNIHGVIRLHPILIMIIDTPQFQRLRELKQLGLTHLIWPTANHSRFEHSIGVCHLAEKFIDVLRKKQPSLKISDQDQMCVMIAGLCHDLGHGPFSHTFDGKYVKKVRPEKSEWKHEHASIQMFQSILEKHPKIKEALMELGFTDLDFTFIEECIHPPSKSKSVSNGLHSPNSAVTPEVKEWLYKGRPKEKSFLYDFISNKHDGLDVDRFDYILRDSKGLNVEVLFGRPSMERLIKNARVMDVPDGTKRICYPANKVMKNLASLGSTRHRLHDIAYQHKTVIALDMIICEIFKLGGEHITTRGDDGELYKLPDCMENMGAYTALDDSILHRIKHAEVTQGQNQSDRDKDLLEAQKLIARIANRDLYYHVATLSDVPPSQLDNIDIELYRKFIAVRSEVSLDCIQCQKSSKDFGMGRLYPLSKVMMFDHKELDAGPKKIPDTMFPPDLPKQCHFVSLLFFSTTRDLTVNRKIQLGFDAWVKTNPLPPLEKGEKEPTPQKRTVTPDKRERDWYTSYPPAKKEKVTKNIGF